MVNGAINQTRGAASGNSGACQAKPECGGKTDPKLAKILLPLLKSSAFRSAVVQAWTRSKPDGPTSGKNEHAFWADSNGDRSRVGGVFPGVAGTIPLTQALSRWDEENIFFHTHPFLQSDGYLYGISDKDVNFYGTFNLIGVVLEADGLYYYDSRDQ
ncbi:hypothetical protein [Edaphosphingomonas haloaromaticamans]|nr:hypothetical protein [Sphingomonas haloaromaticamans]